MLFKNIFILVFFILLAAQVAAQPFSYVYIQGDKTTPFYVKLDGKMLPRYGKNYSIISELRPGPINIEILFQQHEFSPEKFTLQVPENGSRGFLLDKQDGVYALYDLQSKKYLMPGDVEK
jgi:hypothetical protein